MKLCVLGDDDEEHTEDVGRDGNRLAWLLTSNGEFHTTGNDLPLGSPNLHLVRGYYKVQLHG